MSGPYSPTGDTGGGGSGSGGDYPGSYPIVNADVDAAAAIAASKISGTALTLADLPLMPSEVDGVAVTEADTGTVTSTMIADGTILNVDINASAAIAYAKLNLSGAILNADLAGSIAASKLAGSILPSQLTGYGSGLLSFTIGNYLSPAVDMVGTLAQRPTSDATNYGAKYLVTDSGAKKVWLSTPGGWLQWGIQSEIVNADILSSAAIAYSKLALTGSIVNADVASGAAIAYSKLSLGGSIVNGDLAGSIAASKISGTAVTQADTGTVTSTMIADGTILNADINGSAAIAYAKLNLAASVTQADLSAALTGILGSNHHEIGSALAKASGTDGVLAETVQSEFIFNGASVPNGTATINKRLFVAAVYLAKGEVVKGLNFYYDGSGTAGAGTTNAVFVVCTSDFATTPTLTVVAVETGSLGITGATKALRTPTLASNYTAPADGIYYVGYYIDQSTQARLIHFQAPDAAVWNAGQDAKCPRAMFVAAGSVPAVNSTYTGFSSGVPTSGIPWLQVVGTPA